MDALSYGMKLPKAGADWNSFEPTDDFCVRNPTYEKCLIDFCSVRGGGIRVADPGVIGVQDPALPMSVEPAVPPPYIHPDCELVIKLREQKMRRQMDATRIVGIHGVEDPDLIHEEAGPSSAKQESMDSLAMARIDPGQTAQALSTSQDPMVTAGETSHEQILQTNNPKQKELSQKDNDNASVVHQVDGVSEEMNVGKTSQKQSLSGEQASHLNFTGIQIWRFPDGQSAGKMDVRTPRIGVWRDGQIPGVGPKSDKEWTELDDGYWAYKPRGMKFPVGEYYPRPGTPPGPDAETMKTAGEASWIQNITWLDLGDGYWASIPQGMWYPVHAYPSQTGGSSATRIDRDSVSITVPLGDTSSSDKALTLAEGMKDNPDLLRAHYGSLQPQLMSANNPISPFEESGNGTNLVEHFKRDPEPMLTPHLLHCWRNPTDKYCPHTFERDVVRELVIRGVAKPLDSVLMKCSRVSRTREGKKLLEDLGVQCQPSHRIQKQLVGRNAKPMLDAHLVHCWRDPTDPSCPHTFERDINKLVSRDANPEPMLTPQMIHCWRHPEDKFCPHTFENDDGFKSKQKMNPPRAKKQNSRRSLIANQVHHLDDSEEVDDVIQRRWWEDQDFDPIPADSPIYRDNSGPGTIRDYLMRYIHRYPAQYKITPWQIRPHYPPPIVYDAPEGKHVVRRTLGAPNSLAGEADTAKVGEGIIMFCGFLGITVLLCLSWMLLKLAGRRRRNGGKMRTVRINAEEEEHDEIQRERRNGSDYVRVSPRADMADPVP